MAAALASGVSRKRKKVLETRTDSPDLLASLGALSTFYVQNTPQARLNLKSSIEQRAVAINRHFLDASLPTHKALDRVDGDVHALNDSWKKIEEALSSCSASTGNIISTAERLQQELEVITQCQEIVSCFLRDYQLSNEEIHALREEEIDEIFFKALLHVQEIHSNCKVLLRTHHQRAGLELMDMMSVYQGAYESLCSSTWKKSRSNLECVHALHGRSELKQRRISLQAVQNVNKDAAVPPADGRPEAVHPTDGRPGRRCGRGKSVRVPRTDSSHARVFEHGRDGRWSPSDGWRGLADVAAREPSVGDGRYRTLLLQITRGGGHSCHCMFKKYQLGKKFQDLWQMLWRHHHKCFWNA